MILGFTPEFEKAFLAVLKRP